MSTAPANRGKVAEALVQKRLSVLCTSASKISYRLPDARAGSFKATLSDFLYMDAGKIYLLEVKETQHEYRLPYGNFGADQVARLRMWQEAGAVPLVLIYHATLKLWRCYGIERFIDRTTGGSWDLREQEPAPLINHLK